MAYLFRTLRLLSVVVWVGGIIFFAFVLAPVAFSLLPSQHTAGIVVGGALRVLDVVGLVCGAIFCAATGFLYRSAPQSAKRQREFELLIAATMLLGTAWLHVGMLPAMERYRVEAGGDIEAAPLSNPAKVNFEILHKRSERLEGAILFLGLGIILLMGRESPVVRQ